MSSVLCWIWPYLMGGLLGWLAAGWLARIALARQPLSVERVVEKPVDNPSHLAQIAALTATAALVPGLRSQISALEAAPKVVEKIVEKPVTDTAALELRDRQLAAANIKHDELEQRYKRLLDGPAIDVEAARAAGLPLKGPDDLEVVEGIGPKIAVLLNQAGVHRFRELAQMTPAQLQPILDGGGAHFKLAVPDTWPEQALLAAHNQWRALKSLQDVLVAGLRK